MQSIFNMLGVYFGRSVICILPLNLANAQSFFFSWYCLMFNSQWLENRKCPIIAQFRKYHWRLPVSRDQQSAQTDFTTSKGGYSTVWLYLLWTWWYFLSWFSCSSSFLWRWRHFYIHVTTYNVALNLEWCYCNSWQYPIQFLWSYTNHPLLYHWTYIMCHGRLQHKFISFHIISTLLPMSVQRNAIEFAKRKMYYVPILRDPQIQPFPILLCSIECKFGKGLHLISRTMQQAQYRHNRLSSEACRKFQESPTNVWCLQCKFTSIQIHTEPSKLPMVRKY